MNRMNWRNWEHLTPILRIANFWDSDQNGGWVASRYVEEFQMLYVQSGVGEVQIGKQTHPLLPGDLIFYGPGEQHAFGPTTDETLRLVGLAFVFLQEDLSRLTSGRHASPERFKYPKGKPRCPLKPRPPARVSSQPGAGISQLCELLVTTQMSSKDDAAMRKRGLLLMLFDAWHSAAQEKDKPSALPIQQQRAVETAQRHMQTSLQNPPSTDELANAAGLSRAYFARLFKQHTGQSIREYLTQQRLSHARQMLVEGMLNVSQVAYAVGYDDPFYFSRQFTKAFGVSPSRFRAGWQMR